MKKLETAGRNTRVMPPTTPGSDSGRITSLIIYGRSRAFGLMGRDEDIVVRCSDIELVGEDTVLVRFEKDAICIKSHNCRVENLLK